MDVAAAYLQARDLLGEKGVYWQDAEVVRHANRTYSWLHAAICKYDPQVFVETTQVTFPANTERVDLLTDYTISPRLLYSVRRTPLSGAPGPTNVPVLLGQTSFDDLQRRYQSMAPQQQTVVQGQAWPNQPGGFMAALTKDRYLYLAPYPTVTLYLLVDWVPYLADLTSLSSTIQLPARFLPLFPVILAKMLTTKEKRGTLSLDWVMQLVNEQLNPDGPIMQQQEIPYQDPY